MNNLELEFQNEEDTNNVCAIHSVSTPRDLNVIVNSLSLSYMNLGSTKLNILGIQEENTQSIYYFVLDPNLQATMFYFPNQDTPELTLQYYDLVKEYLAGYTDKISNNDLS